ncbi:MAG: ATP-binding protein [Lachnospiraceae bacterium]|nr:ATP-binding protein [Lachnospiraceae bacterium]
MSLSNSQYDRIMNLYDQIRYRQLREQNARIEEVHDKIPELAELESKQAALRAEMIKKIFDSSEEEMDRYQKATEEFLQQKKELLLSHGYPADYEDLRYDCPDCKDTGRLLDGSRCRCFQKRAIEMVYESSNLSRIVERENFRTFSLDYYSKEDIDPVNNISIYELMKYNLETCKRFAKDFPKDPSLSLLITGPTGTGKTFLAHCVADQLLSSGFSVIRLSATQLIEVFEEQQRNRYRYNHEDNFADQEEFSADELRHYLFECDLLIIDDLGTEMPNSFTINKIFTVIDDRQTRQKGTLITTNLSMQAIRDSYTERISSRLFSGYKILQTAGADVRMLSRKQNR